MQQHIKQKSKDLIPNKNSITSSQKNQNSKKVDVCDASYVKEEYDIDSMVEEDDKKWIATMLQWVILAAIGVLAFTIRLFSVVKWESIIHEFDPYFNYRTTKFLASEGLLEFLNWFDNRSWYPLGRIIGGTIYPGLMYTSSCMYWILNTLNISINIRNMCVFLAPIFAANTSFATFFITKHVTRHSGTALLAAAFVATVPSYISRSIGGSYDNEGVAIFALVFTFYLWIKAVTTGSMIGSIFCAFSYFYMVASWGGYVFIINMIPIHVAVILLSGRYSSKVYIAYSTFYVLGSLLAMQIPFVGFNIVKQAECAASHGIFILIQVYAFARWLQSYLNAESFVRLVKMVFVTLTGLVVLSLIALQLFGKLQWTGRSLTLLDPTYASKYIPIIASVSEHQPTTWSNFFLDLHILVFFAPIGIYFLFEDMHDRAIFLIIYGTISWYFAGVMIRLMLTVAPIACILAAIGISKLLTKYFGISKSLDNQDIILSDDHQDVEEEWFDEVFALCKNAFSNRPRGPVRSLPSSIYLILFGIVMILITYIRHCTMLAAYVYSSPSVIFEGRRHSDGSKEIHDDLREGFAWLRQNTDESAVIMSWWDYGYQMSSMANRTNLVDNNTWNNTHIATVGRAFASTESNAYPILQSLDVNYVVVMFGGKTGHRGDDLNKFAWFIRIASGVYPNEIQEDEYLVNGKFDVSLNSSEAMKESVLYKLSYYRFAQLSNNEKIGYDAVRQVDMSQENIELQNFEESFTSENWIVRIFKLKPQANTIPIPIDQSQEDRDDDL